jgi:hypothetical protein
MARGGAAKSAEVDTEDLFGFIEGSDIGVARETELESDAIIRAGRSTGSFADTAAQFQYKYTLLQNFRLTAAATFAYYGIAGVTDMDDRHAAAVQSLSFDARFRLLDRDRSPFGLTLSVNPHWGFADETTGGKISHFGWEGELLMDRELLPKILSTARTVGHNAPKTQKKKVPCRSLRSGTVVAIRATTTAAMAESTIQPYQYMGGLSA